MILERLEVGPLATNCYVVGDKASHEGMVIDPGGDATAILEKVAALELNIKFIVLTHAHFDHIGALGRVKDAMKAEILVHRGDAEALSGGHRAAAEFGFSMPEAPHPDRLLGDGETLLLGASDFRVLHTPGHTPGGICLEGGGVVFTGDTLFNGSIGRTDLPGGDYGMILDSIKTKLLTLPDGTTVYPGHGLESTIGRERRLNPFLLSQ
ncbi:MAG: MBL fold metallo-hydrolase [Chloroflexi bacterium]|nr:MBL fold metallo-hydrolase [Chloroflexota bacterium]